MDDVKTTPKEIEVRREWEHGSEGLGKDCLRSSKRVYTDTRKIPKASCNP